MSTYRSNVVVFLVLIVALVVLKVSQAQTDVYVEKSDTTKYQYCGKRLANALQLLCNGVYNSMFKKSGQAISLLPSEMEMDEYPYVYDYPLRSRASANAMMGRFGGARFRRETRGVHDECCIKACSISELTSYCGP